MAFVRYVSVVNIFRRMSCNAVPKIFVTRNDIPKEAIDMISTKYDVDIWDKSSTIPEKELHKRIKGIDALYCLLTEKISSKLLDAAGPSLKVIGTMSVGYDHIDLPECRKRGVLVGNTPDVLTDATAELTVALLLATSRRLMEAAAELRNGGWSSWSPLWMCGPGLTGSTVGIVGYGRIGQSVAERLKPFKVKRFLRVARAKVIKDDIGAEAVSFEELLKASDFVIVCCALTKETSEMFNKEAFKLMKPTAVFVNTSRGGIVNQDDLCNALKTGEIAAAGLDVMTPEPLPTNHELTKLSNCVLIPHIGSATIQTRVAMACLTSQNIIAGLEGKPLPCPL